MQRSEIFGRRATNCDLMVLTINQTTRTSSLPTVSSVWLSVGAFDQAYRENGMEALFFERALARGEESSFGNTWKLDRTKEIHPYDNASVCVYGCECVRNEIWDSLRMAGPFHGGFCCRWLSAESGLALILPALVSDPMSSVSGMGGSGFCSSSSAAACPWCKKHRQACQTRLLLFTGLCYEIRLGFRVLMAPIKCSEEGLSLLNLKAIFLFPQSALLCNFIYLLQL